MAAEVKVQALVGSTRLEEEVVEGELPKFHHPLLGNSTGVGLIMKLTTPTRPSSKITRANCLHVLGGGIKGQTTVVVVVVVYLPVPPTREVRGHQRTIVHHQPPLAGVEMNNITSITKIINS